MRYMVFVRMRENVGNPPEAMYTAMDAELKESFESGLIIDAGGLGSGPEWTELRVREGEISVTNGPYTEAVEVAGGYSILEVRSHEEAVENARRVLEIHKEHWPGWEGAVEVRAIHDGRPD